MNADALLESVTRRGVRLQASGDRLLVEAPPGALDAATRELIRTHKAELLEILSRSVPVDNQGLPFQPCACGNAHFWKGADTWRCSDCHPMPEGIFLGKTCTVSGGKPKPDCDQLLPANPAQPFVRCGDCTHLQPDTIGDGSGIGICAKGIVPSLRERPLYPQAERYCEGFEARA